MTTKRAETYRQVTEAIGAEGEVAVADLLRDRGLVVRLDAGTAPHDIVIDGSTTVEVKTAHPSPGSNGNRRRWQFKLKDARENRRPMEEDALILRCLENGASAPWHYVIPGCLLAPELTKIDITSRPDHYQGRYSLFLEAWSLIDGIVALNRTRGRQIALPGTDKIPF